MSSDTTDKSARDRQIASHWRVYAAEKAARLNRVYDDNVVGKLVVAAFLRLIDEFIVEPDRARTRILDVGCGIGHLTVPLHDAGYRVTGLDISKSMLDRFDAHKGERDIDVVIGNAADPTGDGRFDVAVSRWVFAHYGDASQLMRGIGSHLKVGGLLIFDILSDDAVEVAAKIHSAPAAEIRQKVFGPLQSLSLAELRRVAGTAGFELVTSVPVALFHRNPIFEACRLEDGVLDDAIQTFGRSVEVFAFLEWVDDRIARHGPPGLSGPSMIVLRKVGSTDEPKST